MIIRYDSPFAEYIKPYRNRVQLDRVKQFNSETLECLEYWAPLGENPFATQQTRIMKIDGFVVETGGSSVVHEWARRQGFPIKERE